MNVSLNDQTPQGKVNLEYNRSILSVPIKIRNNACYFYHSSDHEKKKQWYKIKGEKVK